MQAIRSRRAGIDLPTVFSWFQKLSSRIPKADSSRCRYSWVYATCGLEVAAKVSIIELSPFDICLGFGSRRTTSRKPKKYEFRYLFNVLEQMSVFPTERSPEFEHEVAYNKKTQSEEKKRAVPVSAKFVVAMQLYEEPIFDLSKITDDKLKVAREKYCPSSYKVGRQSDLSIGGSGSFV